MKKGRESTPHIGIFGRRNSGKSSLINCLTGHNTAIVSEVPGTTTDPVKKSFEITHLGPVILIDTAGIDDDGSIGNMRVQKTMDTLYNIDLAILLITNNIFGSFEEKLIQEFNKLQIQYFIVCNKSDLETPDQLFIKHILNKTKKEIIDFSTKFPKNLETIIDQIRTNLPASIHSISDLMKNLIKPNDLVLLVTPIDSEAPEGRMILPQVQTLRSVLDQHGVCIILKESELVNFIRTSGINPRLVITDSQMFPKIGNMIPSKIPLTGFSILFAYYKGNFSAYLSGTPHLSELNDNDVVLLLESCTHQITCDDIGRQKLPNWIKEFTGKKIEFEIVSSLGSFSRPIKEYSIVIQCGGCMLTQKQIISRLSIFIENNIPVTNYGMAIAWMHGIYERAIEPFKKVIN